VRQILHGSLPFARQQARIARPGVVGQSLKSDPAMATVSTAAATAKQGNLFHAHKIKHEFVTGLHAFV
jgi:hypothetical protein